MIRTQIAIVMVDENRNAAIGSVLREPWLLLNVLANVDALEDVVGLAIRLFQLFEDNGGFVACRTHQLACLVVI